MRRLSLIQVIRLVGLVSSLPLDGTLQVANVSRISTESLDIQAPDAIITQRLLDKFILYSEYNAAAYCGPQQGKTGGKVTCGSAKTCPKVEAHETKIYTTWLNQGSAGATGFVAADITDKYVVLTLRGSVSMANWIADAKFLQTKCDKYVPGAYCDIGFMNFWEESKVKAYAGIDAALEDHPGYNIIVTGHSLGGAAAVFAAIEIRRKYEEKKVYLYTYGQPRAGDEKISQYVTDQGGNYRVTHTSDAVPKLPPEYVTGTSAVTGVYKHISPEYWISDGLGNNINKIKKVEGLANYNGNAGTGQLKFNIVAHIQYFQTNMYYCALPLPLGLLGGAGSKRIDEEAAEVFRLAGTSTNADAAGLSLGGTELDMGGSLHSVDFETPIELIEASGLDEAIIRDKLEFNRTDMFP